MKSNWSTPWPIPADLEALQVKGAIRTDFILSAEIMAIALASLDHLSLATTAVALVAVALAITAGVYGVVALIVKLDDIGLHLAERSSRGRAQRSAMGWCACVPDHAERFVGRRHRGDAVGRRRHPAPRPRGTALARSACRTRFTTGRARAGEAAGAVGPVVEWLLYALGSAVAGLIVGGIIVVVVRRFTKHPEELIVD